MDVNEEFQAKLDEAGAILAAAVQAERVQLEEQRRVTRVREQELESATNELRGLVRENQALHADRAALGRRSSELESRWSELERSLGWLVLQKARTVRTRLFREGTLPGRSWALASRFIKSARRSGIRSALKKTLNRILEKIDRRVPGSHGARSGLRSRIFTRNMPVERFRELPWKYLGTAQREPGGKSGHLKILLVSHSACRTGAPLCLLRVARELALRPDVECWIVLKQGGALIESFAAIAPVLEVDDLVAQGVRRDDAPRLIATSFHEFSSRGVAICNTMAVSSFHAALAERNVPVLSWVHELPTFIESLGGRDAVDHIKAASRKIMVPSEAVRAALSSHFHIDADRIRTVYNGQDPVTLGMVRETMRGQVRQELAIPGDAFIVLGCGTIDLRKGADLFVNVARMVLTDPLHESLAGRTWFVWAGHGSDESLAHWLRHDAGIGEKDDRIRFIGAKSSMAPYYMASDVLALTSREDPCPLVNMEAMESGLPVVTFLDAGGAPEVLADAGVCVPYIDSGAMAKSVCELLDDPPLRAEMGRRGQARIRERFTWHRFMDELGEILRADFDCRPARRLRVSVIVPNYRHATYLPERLQSIFSQTLRPHEIIFLDDASPDDSVRVARRLARFSPAPIQFVVNEQNSGSTFRQWLKGLALATGDLVWIAESDDSAHPLFLERLVPEFFEPEVVLAYCQSALIGPQGERLAQDFLAHTDDISLTRWRSRYSVSAAEEAEHALSQKNTIPNASAVLFRRPERLDFSADLENLRFAGDWLFYALLIRSGKINFLPEVLNYYRRHVATVSHRSVREDTQANESLSVKAAVFESYPVSPGAIAASLARSVFEYVQLTERLRLNRPAFTTNPGVSGPLNRIRANLDRRLHASSALRILLVANNLDATDESAAMIGLAGALSGEYTVFLSSARPQDSDPDMVARLDKRVILLEGTPGPTPWSASDEQPNWAARRQSSYRSEILKELIRIHRIDVIHTSSCWADRLILPIIDLLEVPWLIQLSGVLDALAQHADAGAEFSRQATAILSAAAGIFYDRESDFMRLEQWAIRFKSSTSRWVIDRASPIDQIAATCAGAYVEISKVLSYERGRHLAKPATYESRAVPSRSSA